MLSSRASLSSSKATVFLLTQRHHPLKSSWAHLQGALCFRSVLFDSFISDGSHPLSSMRQCMAGIILVLPVLKTTQGLRKYLLPQLTACSVRSKSYSPLLQRGYFRRSWEHHPVTQETLVTTCGFPEDMCQVTAGLLCGAGHPDTDMLLLAGTALPHLCGMVLDPGPHVQMLGFAHCSSWLHLTLCAGGTHGTVR